MAKLSALTYHGGKSAHAPTPIGKWVASHLPDAKAYIEPFAGMCGVLLQRKPSQLEIINDINGHISNWWRVVRDNPDELMERLDVTPYDQREFNRIKALNWADYDDVWRAWAVSVMLAQGVGGHLRKPRFAQNHLIPNAKCVKPSKKWAKIRPLTERMADVLIYNMDAVEFLRRWENETDVVFYCDPPYHTALCDYEHGLDVDAFKTQLLKMRGKVAVSGYAGEMDDLGWRHADKTRIPGMNNRTKTKTERLWMNYA